LFDTVPFPDLLWEAMKCSYSARKSREVKCNVSVHYVLITRSWCLLALLARPISVKDDTVAETKLVIKVNNNNFAEYTVTDAKTASRKNR